MSRLGRHLKLKMMSWVGFAKRGKSITYNVPLRSACGGPWMWWVRVDIRLLAILHIEYNKPFVKVAITGPTFAETQDFGTPEQLNTVHLAHFLAHVVPMRDNSYSTCMWFSIIHCDSPRENIYQQPRFCEALTSVSYRRQMQDAPLCSSV
jgi:hypothetical protein